ncbi:MAG: cation:proton antiporter [Eubacteriales bacterium]|nr:cation:proton antiporter [Eubacteriales bacterium]
MQYVLNLGLILLFTKALGMVSRKFKLPQVVGAILAGLFLGPAMLNIITETEFIDNMSKLGVILLMFSAGIGTDLQAFKKTGKTSFVVALFGVLVPLAGGFLITWLASSIGLIQISESNGSEFLQYAFIGTILTATSVSITVEALKEMGKLNSDVGNTILASAIIDDVLGIIVLTVVLGFADTSVSLWIVLLKVLAFIVVAGAISILFNKVFDRYQRVFHHDKRRFITFALVFCFFMAYIAETYFNVADITGAFMAGLAISDTQRREYIAQRTEVLGYAVFSPIFFASIGLRVSLPSMNFGLIVFSLILLFVASSTKIIGCGLAAKLFKFNNSEALQIGVGMMTRGEVALIIANKGANMGIMSDIFFGPIVIVVIATAILTPTLLKVVFSK